jgi:hypothetical protein
VSQSHDDLRSTSEALQEDADLVKTLELEKERLDPLDPRVVEITRQIEGLMRSMTTKATAQRELVEEIQNVSAD